MFARSWIALLAGAATAAVLGRDAAEVIEFSDTIKHAKPVPAGFFESHLKDVGIAAAMTPADTSLRSRDVTHVYVCINVNFQPACENVALNSGACINFGGNFRDSISSLGPDQGTTCELFQDVGCSGRSVVGIVYPGIWDLRDFNFNDVASSIRCFA